MLPLDSLNSDSANGSPPFGQVASSASRAHLESLPRRALASRAAVSAQMDGRASRRDVQRRWAQVAQAVLQAARSKYGAIEATEAWPRLARSAADQVT